MSDDLDKTTIIPGLREHDTAPLGLSVVQGRHRVRRGAPMPRWATALVFGAPVAAVAVTVGMVLPGWVAGTPDEVTASPSHPATAPTTAEPLPPLPTPSRSRADRSRPRDTRPPVAPSSPRRSISPTPTPRPSKTRTSPAPSRSSDHPTGSSSPTAGPSDIGIPIPTAPSPQETGNG